MKYMKRKNIYQCSNYNCTFDPVSKRAMSYKWWAFVAEVEGKIVFNNYRYSNSTSKHQSKVRSLLNELGIKIDLELPIPNGLPGSHIKTSTYGVLDFVKREDLSLADLILEAEEYLCDKFLSDVLKKQDAYQRAKIKKAAAEKLKLESMLGNVADCTEIYKRLDRVNTILTAGSEK